MNETAFDNISVEREAYRPWTGILNERGASEQSWSHTQRGEDAHAVRPLYPGAQITIIGERDGWYQIGPSEFVWPDFVTWVDIDTINSLGIQELENRMGSLLRIVNGDLPPNDAAKRKAELSYVRYRKNELESLGRTEETSVQQAYRPWRGIFNERGAREYSWNQTTPGVDVQAVKALCPDTSVTVIGEHDGWYQIGPREFVWPEFVSWIEPLQEDAIRLGQSEASIPTKAHRGGELILEGEGKPVREDVFYALRRSVTTLRLPELEAIVDSLNQQITTIINQEGNPQPFIEQRSIVEERLRELQNLASITDPVTIGHRMATLQKQRDTTTDTGVQRACDIELEVLHETLKEANRIQDSRATAQERTTTAKAQIRRKRIDAIHQRLFGTSMDDATWATIPHRATPEAVESAWSKKRKPKEEKAPPLPEEPFLDTFLSTSIDLRLPEQGATEEQKKAIQLTRLIQRDGRTITFGIRLKDAEFGIEYTQPLDELPGLIERESGCYEGMIAFLAAIGVPITDYPTPENAFSETNFTQSDIDHFVNKAWRGLYRKLARTYHPDYLSPKSKPSNHAAWIVLKELQKTYPALTQDGMETLATTIHQSLEQMNSLFTNDSKVGRERPRNTDSVRTFFSELARVKQGLAS